MWKTVKAARAVLSISNVGTVRNGGPVTRANRAANPAFGRIAALMLAGMLVSCGGGGGSSGTGASGNPPPGGGGSPGAPIAITSPAAGAIVAGNVDITADVTASDVVGVQFQADGNNIGAEDTTAPYGITLDTVSARVSDGPHVLTAIARDSSGSQFTSAPVNVVVANTAPAPEPAIAGRVEETDPSVVLSAGWTAAGPNYYAWSGGTAVQSAAPTATATFTFSGTSVAWIGHRSGSSGIALVKVDNGAAVEVDLFARTVEMNIIVWSKSGLAPGTHTLTIAPKGTANSESVGNAIVVDAFAAPAPVISRLQETDPDVTFTGTWAQADPGFGWSGGGVFTVGSDPVGGARVSTTAGSTATLSFRGTGVTVIGYRGRDAGKASISVDGGAATTVDMYSPVDKIEAVVFTTSGLADVTHSITVTALGTNNGVSTDSKVVVDAFDVTTPGRRYQENDPAVVYSPGDWIYPNINRTWSEGAIAESSVAGAKVTFTFVGTSVSFIGCRKLSTGEADVRLDGVLVAHLNTYLAPAPSGTLAVGTEAYQTTLYRADGLLPIAHTLEITVTSPGSYTVVDAFDVR
jgi:Bacterial Ig domain